MEFEVGVSKQTEPQKLQMLRAQVKNLMFPARSGREAPRGAEFLGSMPVTMGRRHLRMIAECPYYVLEKSDGNRYMLLINHDNYFLIDRRHDFYLVSRRGTEVLSPPTTDQPVSTHSRTLLDGELVMNRRTKKYEYLIYDVISLNGNASVSQLPLSERIERLQALLLRPLYNKENYPEGFLFPLRLKDFYEVKHIDMLFSKIKRVEGTSHYMYDNPENSDKSGIPICNLNDGVIFAPDMKYVPQTCEALLKWKYPDHNSIDFRLNIKHEEGRIKTYLLYQSEGRERLYRECTFPRAVREKLAREKAQGSIIECAYDLGAGEWRYMRTREDKHRPNFHATVIDTLESIAQNLGREELIHFLKKHARSQSRKIENTVYDGVVRSSIQELLTGDGSRMQQIVSSPKSGPSTPTAGSLKRKAPEPPLETSGGQGTSLTEMMGGDTAQDSPLKKKAKSAPPTSDTKE